MQIISGKKFDMKKDILRPKNIGGGAWNKKIAGELAEQAKFYSKAGKVLEKMGYIGVGVDVIVGVYNNVQEGTSWQRTASDAFVDLTISLFILLASVAIAPTVGAVIGAIVGTFVGPGPGTAVGTFLGAGIGLAILNILIAALLNGLFNKWEVYEGKTISEIMKESVWITVNSIANAWNNTCSCCE